MVNKLKENRIGYDWSKLESELEYRIPKSFKDFYEKYGPIGIDDYIYIVGAEETDSSYSLKEHVEYTKYAYNYLLSTQLDDYVGIDFYDGGKGWLPVGYTTNGDTIFCNNKEVMVADEGFDDKEVYKGSIENFIDNFIRGNIEDRLLCKVWEDSEGVQYYR